MKYICSWSGGKDSTASVILAHLHNEPLDEIIFAEVMYDHKRNISGENPRHIEFIMNVAKPLFESWGYKVRILRAESDFLSFFNRVIENPRKHKEHKGMKFGFPSTGYCGVKRDMKLKPINDYYVSIKEDITQYVGLCIDEPDRLESMKKDNYKVSLLEKYGYTEKMSYDLCKEYGLLSPTYKLSKRGGCWFCPYAKLKEHMEIKERNPELWYEFVALEDEPNVAFNKYNCFRKSLREIDQEIEDTKAQMIMDLWK